MWTTLPGVTLGHGDCLELLKQIPSGFVDLVLTDPPYEVTAHKRDVMIDPARLWAELLRIGKPTTPYVFTTQMPFTFELYAANKAMFRYDLVWDKVLPTGMFNAKRMPLRTHETILVFYAETPVYNPQFWEGEPNHSWSADTVGEDIGGQNYGSAARLPYEATNKKYPQSVVRVAKPHSTKTEYRTQKPVELFEWLIRTYSNDGAIVLDPCVGSGTTALAARMTNRLCVAMTRRRLEAA